MTCRRLSLALAASAHLAAVLWLAAPARALDPPGWKRIDIPSTGSYFLRYLPQSVTPLAPAPVIVFLHGAGGTPELYEDLVQQSAENARAVLVLPKSSSSVGWGLGSDEQTVAESLRLARADLAPLVLDESRTSIAGHSAGGAYAYLLAYTEVSRYSAVFTLSARFYPVASVADPSYRAPIHMYYGTTDPNYTDGDEASLKAQWDRLGVPWEENVVNGFGHNVWPVASMMAGFGFLVGKSYPLPPSLCTPGPATLCLLGGRYRVEVTWRDGQGDAGAGMAAGCPSDGSGLFWFFSPDNWELMVKLIDGCAVNHRVWVFSAATTDVGYTLAVTDTTTGRTVRYENPFGKTAPAIIDTSAFTSCPP
ncbi:MAG TPA: alpha/beta hydrolase-fold protein [Thermoanaerobaculia bacterium]